jgi:hypothetical protein
MRFLGSSVLRRRGWRVSTKNGPQRIPWWHVRSPVVDATSNWWWGGRRWPFRVRWIPQAGERVPTGTACGGAQDNQALLAHSAWPDSKHSILTTIRHVDPIVYNCLTLAAVGLIDSRDRPKRHRPCLEVGSRYLVTPCFVLGLRHRQLVISVSVGPVSPNFLRENQRN